MRLDLIFVESIFISHFIVIQMPPFNLSLFQNVTYIQEPVMAGEVQCGLLVHNYSVSKELAGC